MTLVVVKAEDADGEPCLWQRTEADARSLIDAIGADSALGRAEPTRRPKWARWAVVNRTAPPAPRRPVAGWAGTADRMVLRVGAMRAVAIGAMRPWWDVTNHVNARHEAPFSVVDEGDAPTIEAAQLAAEDALHAVLVDAATALGLRVVPS